MTKFEAERLRGRPIAELPHAEDVPCNETSNAEKLCKRPVVSVVMTAYNHEKYIRQAIEGVMMQKTDFEYELIIGEDCSKDRTREICFDYQKKFPDKIRVLWSEENVFAMGGSVLRIQARCRGEFLAICEGDDYWTDPEKLQKQVGIMRMHPSVGMVFSRATILHDWNGTTCVWNGNGAYAEGLIRGRDFFLKHLLGNNGKDLYGEECYVITGSTLHRRSVFDRVNAKFEILRWQLLLGDTTLWLGMSAESDVYFLGDVVSVYRQNCGGITQTDGTAVCCDATLVRIWFAQKCAPDIRSDLLYRQLFRYHFRRLPWLSVLNRRRELAYLRSVPELSCYLQSGRNALISRMLGWRFFPVRVLVCYLKLKRKI